MKFKNKDGETLELTPEEFARARESLIDSNILNIPTEKEQEEGYYLVEE